MTQWGKNFEGSMNHVSESIIHFISSIFLQKQAEKNAGSSKKSAESRQKVGRKQAAFFKIHENKNLSVKFKNNYLKKFIKIKKTINNKIWCI